MMFPATMNLMGIKHSKINVNEKENLSVFDKTRCDMQSLRCEITQKKLSNVVIAKKLAEQVFLSQFHIL